MHPGEIWASLHDVDSVKPYQTRGKGIKEEKDGKLGLEGLSDLETSSLRAGA